MAFNQQNLSAGTAFVRLMFGSVMTTYGTIRLLREPKSRSGKMLVLFGSMKAAEGVTKFCPTKAIGNVMENLANENVKQGNQTNVGTTMNSETQPGQNGNIMKLVESIAQKITSGNAQSTSTTQSNGGNQSTGQNTMGSNAQSIGNIAQTIAPQFSQAVKELTGMAGSQNASGAKNPQTQASGANEAPNKNNTSGSSNNSKSAYSSTNKDAASPKSDTKSQLDGAAKNSNLDSSIIEAVVKSGHKNTTTPNILQ